MCLGELIHDHLLPPFNSHLLCQVTFSLAGWFTCSFGILVTPDPLVLVSCVLELFVLSL